MAMNSKSFPKSDFEVLDGNYLIVAAPFVIPNPKSDDPEKQEKIDKALEGREPETMLRLELADLDGDLEPIDLEHTKRLDLKYGPTSKCRPFDEPDADLSDASEERGSEGRYAIPASYAPHASSKPGFFLAALENVAGFNRLPTDCNDGECLVGLKLSIRRVLKEAVKDKATGKVGEHWYQYEPYDILEDPNDAGTSKKKVVKKTTPVKAEAPTSAPAKAAPTKAPVKKVAPPPPPVEEPEEPEADNDSGEVDIESIFQTIVSTAIENHVKKNKKAPTPMQVRLASAIGLSKLPADQQGPVKAMLKDDDMLVGLIDMLTPKQS